ncbi:MAG: hypothetical protein IH947_14925 [Bacteroidetes bacterium]|nr:hypothetical protein [Bacteroidota bacterium]
MPTTEIRQQLEFIEKELVDEFDQYGQLMTVSADTTILREGQYVKVIPLVLKGFIKCTFPETIRNYHCIIHRQEKVV